VVPVQLHLQIINIEEWRREERGEPMSLYKREEGQNKTTQKILRLKSPLHIDIM
jgi:hypothetical protein